MKLYHYLTPYTKIKLRWIADLDAKRKLVNLLEGNETKYL